MTNAHISFPITQIRSAIDPALVHDDLVVEEPLEIRVENQTLTITMRTPGDDFALALGFMHCEGVIASAKDVASIRHCERNNNIVRVELIPGVSFDSTSLQRNFISSSSCGVCGKTTLDRLPEVKRATPSFALELLMRLPSQLKKAQSLFHLTGGSHAAGLFDRESLLISCKEDIGRHNAVDKVIGHALMQKFDLSQLALCTSGRASFEILQKAITVGIGTVVAVGAPSTLAVKLANEHQLTLLGFTGDTHCNVYA